jgi:hypothetical protein
VIEGGSKWGNLTSKHTFIKLDLIR